MERCAAIVGYVAPSVCHEQDQQCVLTYVVYPKMSKQPKKIKQNNSRNARKEINRPQKGVCGIVAIAT